MIGRLVNMALRQRLLAFFATLGLIAWGVTAIILRWKKEKAGKK